MYECTCAINSHTEDLYHLSSRADEKSGLYRWLLKAFHFSPSIFELAFQLLCNPFVHEIQRDVRELKHRVYGKREIQVDKFSK